MVAAIVAVALPLILATTIEPARAAGRALWEWSAAGGPTVQASYRFDGIAAVGVAVGAAYAGAGLFGAARATTRHPLLPSAVLAIGLVFFALAVTEDLIAGTVVLGVLASITIVATLAVAPLPATTRLAAVVLAYLPVAMTAARDRRFPVRGAVVATVVVSLLVAYPALHWSHLALFAALISVLYAATVSLALPEQWEVVRYDVTLAALWIALAVGTPTAIAGGLFILAADALSALAESVWTSPLASHIVVIAGSAAATTGPLLIG